SEVDRCFRDLVVPGRLELIDAARHLWVDVGHNPHAARFLAGRIQALKAQHTSARCCVLFSMLSDKDIESVTEILKPVVDVWYLFPLSVPRACSLEQLESLARKQTLEFKSFGSAGDALRDLLQSGPDQTPTQFNVACGSFYTVAAVKNEWKRLNGK
ncbi:MAG: hypothetical protein MI864_24950, partial [Pseudomonadales bacterium]|nr:hypothetical protein [Pseudomonadales bacterium]